MWSSTLDSSALICSTSGSESSRRARRATWSTCSRSITRPESRRPPGLPAARGRPLRRRAGRAAGRGSEAPSRARPCARRPWTAAAERDRRGEQGGPRRHPRPRHERVGQVAVRGRVAARACGRAGPRARRDPLRRSARRGRRAAQRAAARRSPGEGDGQGDGRERDGRHDGPEGPPQPRCFSRASVWRDGARRRRTSSRKSEMSQAQGPRKGRRTPPSRRRADIHARNLPGARLTSARARRRPRRRVQRVAQQQGDRHRAHAARTGVMPCARSAALGEVARPR
jgi:hypothetical protein